MFLMHLRKHDSFDVAGDTVLGNSLLQSLCADLAPPSSFHGQRNSWGSGMCSSWGSRQRTGRAPTKDGCYTCGGDHFAANCPDCKGGPRGRDNHSIGWGGHGGSFPQRPHQGRGDKLCAHLMGRPHRSVSWCNLQARNHIIAMV